MRNLLILGLVLAGCSNGPSTSTLQGASESIPLYQPARLKNFESSDVKWCSGKQLGTYVWVWKSTDSQDKIVEHYRKSLSQAQLTTTPAGDKVFTWTTFPDAGKDEAVTVNISKDGTFRISECRVPEKRSSLQQVIDGFPADNDIPR